MKAFISYILGSLILLSVSLNTLILSHFTANYDYIVSELCVEKDIKDSCCKGSCHLTQEFTKVENTAQGESIQFLQKIEILNWFKCDFAAQNMSFKTDSDIQKDHSSFDLLSGINFPIEHPPKSVF